MKYFATLTLAFICMIGKSQDNEATFERPKTEITVGFSNIKFKDEPPNLFIYNDYDYYPYYYFSPTSSSLNLGLRQKLKKGALRIQGEFGISNQSIKEEPSGQNYGSTYTNSSINTYNTAGKIGYDFFQSFKRLEINYGIDLIVDYWNIEVRDGYDYYENVYDPNTGQSTSTYSYSYTNVSDYSEIAFGAGLNLGVGFRVTQKIKIGLESNVKFLYGTNKYDYESGSNPDYSDTSSGTSFKSKVNPLGLLYVAFGF